MGEICSKITSMVPMLLKIGISEKHSKFANVTLKKIFVFLFFSFPLFHTPLHYIITTFYHFSFFCSFHSPTTPPFPTSHQITIPLLLPHPFFSFLIPILYPLHFSLNSPFTLATSLSHSFPSPHLVPNPSPNSLTPPQLYL